MFYAKGVTCSNEPTENHIGLCSYPSLKDLVILQHFSTFQVIVVGFMICSLTSSLSLIAPINPISTSSRQLSSLKKIFTPPAQLQMSRRVWLIFDQYQYQC